MTRFRGADEGFTLIEVLVAMTLLSVAVVVIVSAMMTSIVTADVHRKQASAETVVRGYAEAARDYAQAHYAPCATTYAVPFSPPAGYTVSLNGVDYWNGSGWTPQPAPLCGPTSPTIQRLRLEADATDSRAKNLVQIVVRKP
jgi:prepilin-type N-terminal cleavage/methylation domain-containing protein